jgi:hypothetical protein
MGHRSRFIGAGAIAFASGMLIALPAFSSGATVKNDLRSFQAAQTRAAHTAANPQTEPPLHGTNPHAQGTAAVVDLSPSATRPFSVDAAGTSNDEDIVVGRSRGEQRADGTYHGHITVAALFGNEIIAAADTGPGEHKAGSLLPAVLDPLCTATGICVGAVQYDSNTTTTGSFNSFRTLSIALGGATQLPGLPALPGVSSPALSVGAASSVANISSDGTCQVSEGGSNVANVRTAGAVAVNAATSASRSSACRGQASTQTNGSSVVELGGNPLPLLGAGCANGTADTTTGLPGVLPIICNADDSSTTGGTQANLSSDVYGVRNALDVYVLAIGNSALAQVSAAQSESLAVAPAAAVVTPPTTTTPAAPTPAATTTTPTTPATATDNTGPADNTGTGDNAGNDVTGNDNTGSGGSGSPQCSDKVDNDGDGVIDAADPGCHSDGNAGNPASYNPNDDSEANGSASLSGKQLPFTGTDVVVLGLAGALLLAAGLTLRGPARRRETNA